jgi:tetratricopeptide (TPR) repeat protein
MPMKNTVIIAMLILTSCSGVSTKRKMVDNSNSKQRSKWIAKSQYDALLEKYNDLNERHNALREEKLSSQNSLLDELNNQTPALKKKESEASKPVIFTETVNVDLVNSDVSDYSKAKQLKQQGSMDAALVVFQKLEQSKNRQIRVRAKEQTGLIFMQMKKYDLALQVFESIISSYAYSGLVINSLENAYKCSNELGLVEKKLQYKSMLEDFFGIKV